MAGIMQILSNLEFQSAEKRARPIASMGLVEREGDHFKVSSPSGRSDQKIFEVRRNEAGAVVCTCPAFLESRSDNRCEHILAVKFAPRREEQEPSGRNRMLCYRRLCYKSGDRITKTE